MRLLITLFALFISFYAFGQTYPSVQQPSNLMDLYRQSKSNGVIVFGTGAPLFTPTLNQSRYYIDTVAYSTYLYSGGFWNDITKPLQHLGIAGNLLYLTVSNDTVDLTGVADTFFTVGNGLALSGQQIGIQNWANGTNLEVPMKYNGNVIWTPLDSLNKNIFNHYGQQSVNGGGWGHGYDLQFDDYGDIYLGANHTINNIMDIEGNNMQLTGTYQFTLSSHDTATQFLIYTPYWETRPSGAILQKSNRIGSIQGFNGKNLTEYTPYGFPTSAPTNGTILKYNSSTKQYEATTIPIMVTNEFISTSGQVSFTLANTPYTGSQVAMYRSGILVPRDSYTVSGATVTYDPNMNGGLTFTLGTRATFVYTK